MKEVEFIGSFEEVEQCPVMNLPEYAFIGRSNVGKSSLINYLTEHTSLARISKKPGKTQTINLYKVDNRWVFADLPGYGFAHVSKSKRKKWEDELWDYLKKRNDLMCAVVLIDASIPAQKIDLEFLDQLGFNAIPWILAFTKIDKVNSSKRNAQLEEIRNEILKRWTELPAEFITSTTEKMGREELLEFILKTNESYFLSMD